MVEKLSGLTLGRNNLRMRNNPTRSNAIRALSGAWGVRGLRWSAWLLRTLERSRPKVSADGRRRHVGVIASEHRRGHPDGLNMGAGAGTGEALPCIITSDVHSTSPGHRTNSGA